MVRTLIQFLALTCSLLASFFLIKGSLGLKANDIAELASTKFDYNPHVMNNLIEQQVNSEIGFILLLCSFILQGINMLWPMRFCDFEINSCKPYDVDKIVYYCRSFFQTDDMRIIDGRDFNKKI